MKIGDVPRDILSAYVRNYPDSLYLDVGVNLDDVIDLTILGDDSNNFEDFGEITSINYEGNQLHFNFRNKILSIGVKDTTNIRQSIKPMNGLYKGRKVTKMIIKRKRGTSRIGTGITIDMGEFGKSTTVFFEDFYSGIEVTTINS